MEPHTYIGMKKKQHRFKSEREIHAAINDLLRRVAALTKEAEELDKTGHEYMRLGPDMADAGRGLLDKACTIRESSIPRIENTLTKLKHALAAYHTELLPGMGKDKAVVLEPL